VADTPLPVNSKPRVRRLDSAARAQMLAEISGLATVCQAANCPNIGECWQRGTATFMILGETCTRNCKFCNVASGKPAPPDPTEPERIADAVARLKLKFAVLTCVDRDDLPDFGAAHWATCLAAVRARCPGVGVEALAGDFQGRAESIALVVQARPDVFAHNVETVPRLQRAIRHPASWERSVDVLRQAKALAVAQGIALHIKSGLMAGLGETDDELEEALWLLAEAGVELVTIGQYLKPLNAPGRLPVQRYVSAEQFQTYADWARAAGFKGVASSPLTRSSHFAETLLAQAHSASNGAASGETATAAGAIAPSEGPR
jgi:lipoyl synthase